MNDCGIDTLQKSKRKAFGRRWECRYAAQKLGGTLLCEKDVPFKEKLHQYIELQKRLISREPGIEVRLNTEVTPGLASELAPDVILAAMGARPLRPPIPGIDLPVVKMAEDVYRDPALAGRNTVILGGGLVGMELAIYLSMLGKKCTIIEMTPRLNDGGNNLHGLAISTQLREQGIHVSISTRAAEIREDGVLCEFTGEEPEPQAAYGFGLPNYTSDAKEGTKFYPADTVICAAGMAPLRDESLLLKDCAPEFYMIGDCVMPRNIWQATSSGHYIARDIGVF